MCLRYKFFHPPDHETEKMTRALGLAAPTRESRKGLAEHCDARLRRQRAANKLAIKTNLALHFNETVQAHLFLLFEDVWWMMIDERARYRIACLVASKQGLDVLRATTELWMPYTGPLHTLATDQEGEMSADGAALVAERRNATSVLAEPTVTLPRGCPKRAATAGE